MAAKVRDIAQYADARLIGEGGFGAVYRARDERHGRDVAIKVLPSDLGDEERARFERERQVMGSLGAHLFVIPVHESGLTDDGEPFIVMQFASGGSLGERVRASGPVPWAEAAKVMAAVADAVQFAHENGVLHRDIKPDNVLIDQFGHPKLADFGIAAVANTTTSAADGTAATIAHAAPELMRGEPSTEATDIYAIGSSVYGLIKGTPAFYRQGDEDMGPMAERIQNEPPPDLREVGIPDDLATAIERAMAKDPDDRQTSAAALAQELRAAAAGVGPPTGPLTIAPEDLPTIGEPTAMNGSSANGSSATKRSEDTKATDADTEGAGKADDNAASKRSRGRGSGAGSSSDEGSAEEGSNKKSSAKKPAARKGSNKKSSAKKSAARKSSAKGRRRNGGVKAETTNGASHSNGSRGGDAADTATATADATQSGGKLATDLDVTDTIDGETTNLDASDESIPDETDPGSDTALRKPGAPPLPPHRFQSTTDPEPEWSAGRVAALGVAAVAFIAAVATAIILIGNDDDAVQTEGGGPSGPTASAAPTIEVDCPTSIPVNARVRCSIFTTDAVSGEWHLPAFIAEPKPIETVPGEFEIFVSPTNPDAVGRDFSLIVDAVGGDGTTERLNHDFTVVGTYAEVACPDRIALGESVVCNIVSYNATEGEWTIPHFGGSELEIVPGANTIFIEPSDPDSVGETYEITVEVRNDDGDSFTATSAFEVIPTE